MTIPRSTLGRRAAGLSLVAASAVALSGCIKVTNQASIQADSVGDVVVSSDLCQNGALDSGYNTGIPSPSPIQTNAAGCILNENVQGRPIEVFVSYLVPDGAVTPATLTATGGRAGTFSAMSASDTSTITVNTPAPTGFHWQSYRSAKTNGLAAGGAGPLSATVTARFDASALPGDFKYAELIGWRWLASDASDTSFADDRPLDCTGAMMGPSPTTGANCYEATVPDPLTTGVSTHRAAAGRAPVTPSESDYNWITVPVNRLTLTAPAAASADAGTTAHVSFAQTSSLGTGNPATSIGVAGSTTVPGATVSTDATLALGSSTAIGADITIPASTPTGDYDVQVDVGSGTATRTAHAALHVTAKPAATPAPSRPGASATPTPTPTPAATPTPTVPELLAASAQTLSTVIERPKKVSQLRKGAATVPVTVPTAGKVRVSLVSAKKVDGKLPVLAVGEATAKAAGKVNVTIKRTPEGRALLRSGDPVDATLVVRLWAASGKVVTTGIAVTLD